MPQEVRFRRATLPTENAPAEEKTDPTQAADRENDAKEKTQTDRTTLQCQRLISDAISILNDSKPYMFSADLRLVSVSTVTEKLSEAGRLLPKELGYAQAVLADTEQLRTAASEDARGARAAAQREAEQLRQQAHQELVKAQTASELAQQQAQAITDDANRKAQQIIADAQAQAAGYYHQAELLAQELYQRAQANANALVQQDSIMTLARQEAERIRREAQTDADNYRRQLYTHVDSVLLDLERTAAELAAATHQQRERLTSGS